MIITPCLADLDLSYLVMIQTDISHQGMRFSLINRIFKNGKIRRENCCLCEFLAFFQNTPILPLCIELGSYVSPLFSKEKVY